MAWHPYTSGSLPAEGRKVLVCSPEIAGDLIVCRQEQGRLVPVNPILREAWEAGRFRFAAAYWHPWPVQALPIVRMT